MFFFREKIGAVFRGVFWGCGGVLYFVAGTGVRRPRKFFGAFQCIATNFMGSESAHLNHATTPENDKSQPKRGG